MMMLDPKTVQVLLQPAGSIWSSPASRPRTMLTLALASAIVDHALAYARAHNLAPMTIAALDARGCIVALKMEDGSGQMRPEIAARKAWGALGVPARHRSERAEEYRSRLAKIDPAAPPDGPALRRL